MSIFLSEFLGTAILLSLGNGVVANVVLNKTKGHNGGWIVISFGWAIAVFVGVFVAAKSSGAHLNPAVTIAFLYLKKISWECSATVFSRSVAGRYDRKCYCVAYLPAAF